MLKFILWISKILELVLNESTMCIFRLMNVTNVCVVNNKLMRYFSSTVMTLIFTSCKTDTGCSNRMRMPETCAVHESLWWTRSSYSTRLQEIWSGHEIESHDLWLLSMTTTLNWVGGNICSAHRLNLVNIRDELSKKSSSSNVLERTRFLTNRQTNHTLSLSFR